MNRIVFTKHALKQLVDRGISKEETRETILTSLWIAAQFNRYFAIKIFNFESVWLGEFYDKKEVKVIFTEDGGKITVITAIARYFKEEKVH